MQQFLTFVVNHWFLWSMLVVVVLLLLLLELQQKVGGVAKLSPQQLVNMMNHENAVVVDVRPSEAFASGHILGAQNIPTDEIEMRVNKLEKYKKMPIIIVCMAGAQALKVGKQLYKLGFEKVYHLQGGMNAWRSANFPTKQGQ